MALSNCCNYTTRLVQQFKRVWCDLVILHKMCLGNKFHADFYGSKVNLRFSAGLLPGTDQSDPFTESVTLKFSRELRTTTMRDFQVLFVHSEQVPVAWD